MPSTLREARDLFSASEMAHDAFGDEVVAHYVNMADVELAAYDAVVTDWERVRGFERLVSLTTPDLPSIDTVFAPVRSQTAFEETLERLGTAIKLGPAGAGRAPARRARAVHAAGDLALDAAPGADRAGPERPPAGSGVLAFWPDSRSLVRRRRYTC